MKKLIFIFYIIFVPKIIFAAYLINTDEVKLKIYGTIYGDLFYSNGSAVMLNNFYGTGSNSKTITSNAAFGSTKLGFNIDYKKMEVNYEAGISELVRKFYFKYYFNKENNHFLQFGKDTNLAFYYFGQMSNDGQSLIDYGSIISRRRLQARYGYNNFEAAVILPYINFRNSSDRAYSKDENREYIFKQIPQIEAAYNYNSEHLYVKPFVSYGAFLYRVNDKNYTAHQYTAGIGGRSTFGKFFADYMVYFGQNMYLNSTYGAYSGLSNTVNPVTISNNKANINNYYSAGGGLGFGYYYNKFLFQLGAGCNMNYDKKLYNIHSSAGSYINTRYYISDIFSVLFEAAYLDNIYDISKTNKGSALITGGMFILSF